MARITLHKPTPDLISFWLTVSGFSQTDPVQKQPGVQESLGLVLANVSSHQADQDRMQTGSACLLHKHYDGEEKKSRGRERERKDSIL